MMREWLMMLKIIQTKQALILILTAPKNACRAPRGLVKSIQRRLSSGGSSITPLS